MDPEENENEGPDFIHPPDKMEDDPRNGLVCFLNMDRPCGPDCMAYTTLPSEAPQLNHQQRNCVLLVSVERLGRHTGILAKLNKELIDQGKKARADKSRTEQTPPPSPFGGQRS